MGLIINQTRTSSKQFTIITVDSSKRLNEESPVVFMPLKLERLVVDLDVRSI
jgi:hypothetical protein